VVLGEFDLEVFHCTFTKDAPIWNGINPITKQNYNTCRIKALLDNVLF